jgi:hypothetical protein
MQINLTATEFINESKSEEKEALIIIQTSRGIAFIQLVYSNEAYANEQSRNEASGGG